MSPRRSGWRPSERRLWMGACFSLAFCIGVWSFSTPLFTGPDEVSQVRRAAAVVRGELTGHQAGPGPALLLTVEVPPLYGDPAEQNFLCHVGPLLEGAPQEAMALPSPPCPELHAASRRSEGRDTVEAETVQYRGQPFFYGLVGLPTLLSEGVEGAYAMRIAGALITAALLASAMRTIAVSRRRPLAALGLLACVTPGVLYLGGSTNPSAVEIAAALSAWAAVAVLASSDPPPDDGAGLSDDPLTGRLVRRLGTALVVLAVCRGLGPAFVAAVLAVGAMAAGGTRVRLLLARRDFRLWGLGVAAAVATSALWLVHIGSDYPLPERPGSGFTQAFGWLPWYLHQSVGVFGTNDSGVAPVAAIVWWLVAAAATAVGVVLLVRDGRRGGQVAALGLATLAVGLLMNVTAEGLSLPPIGFFWQGRYALPLAFGGIVLCTTAARPGGGAEPQSSLATPTAATLAAMVLVAVHVHAMWVVAEHHHGAGTPVATSAALFYGISMLHVVEDATGRVFTRRRPRGHPVDR